MACFFFPHNKESLITWTELGFRISNELFKEDAVFQKTNKVLVLNNKV